ncbi:GldG family protein, partial [bacterium]|nr:GldG family protein [bacterium]
MNRFFDSMSSLGILFIALIVVNLVSSQFYTKADITEEKLYSLSEGTKTILGKLESELHIKYYVNKESEAIPLYLKSYGQRVAELFQEYADHSNGKITLEVLDPKADTEDEEWASKYGIKGLPLPNGDSFRMGAVFLSGSGEEVIGFFNPQKESFLEYEITEAISKTQKTNRKKVAVITSYDMFASAMPFQMPNQPPPKKGWMIIKELQKLYDVEELRSDIKEIPEVDLLMLVHPKQLSDDTTFAIDQYVMNGGRMIVMVDPSSQSEPQGQMGAPQGPKSSDLRKLFTKWGMQYNPNLVTGDIDNPTRIRSAQGAVDFPIWMTLKEGNTNKDNIAVSNLETLMMIEAGSFSLNDKVKDITYTSLLDTSVNAG